MDIGLNSTKNFFELVSSIDLSTIEKFQKFEMWKKFDGTKEGLLRLPVMKNKMVSSEYCFSKDIDTYEGIHFNDMTEINKLLNKCTNLYGIIDQNIKDRIINYLSNPSIKNWDDIYSICINGVVNTIWKAVGNVDKDFQSYIIKDIGWTMNPSPETVIKGIEITVNNH